MGRRHIFGIPLHISDPGLFALSVVVTMVSMGTFGFILAVSAVRTGPRGSFPRCCFTSRTRSEDCRTASRLGRPPGVTSAVMTAVSPARLLTYGHAILIVVRSVLHHHREQRHEEWHSCRLADVPPCTEALP